MTQTRQTWWCWMMPALGFRDHPELWPQVLKNPDSQPWVILKLSYPIANNQLLAHLVATCPDRLITVVTANDLRLANAQISRGLSWERVAQDTLWELSYGPEMKELAKCAHVVVSYKADGAVLISRTGARLKCKLFFDPNTIENGWETGFTKAGWWDTTPAWRQRLPGRAGSRPAGPDANQPGSR